MPKRHTLRSLLLSAAMLCGLAGESPAQPSTELPPTDLVNILISKGGFDAAASAAAGIASQSRQYAWLPEYVRINRMLATGEAAKAEPHARTLLKQHPDETDIRHLLVNILIAQKKYKAARYHIGKSTGKLRDDELDATYKRYLDAYLKVHKPYGMKVSFGATPSTNANRGSAEETVDIGGLSFNLDDNAKAQEGVNLEATLSAFYLQQIGEDTDLLMQGAATLSKNTSSEDNDIVTLVASPQLQHRFDKGRFGIGPVAEYQFVGYAPYVARYGVAGSVSYKLTPDIIIQSQAKFVWQDYDKEDYRDGTKFTGLSRILFPVADQLTGDVSVRYEFERTQRDYLDSNLAGVGVGLTRKWERFDLATSVSAEYAVREFDGNYPLAGYARKDEKLTLSVSASSNRFSIMGTRPSIGYEYVQNNSNIAIKSYNSHNILVGTKRSF
tara:strand:+ start:384 stop:1706 length:1323 start_codon:yes stop_codon:yes gene_type:complete